MKRYHLGIAIDYTGQIPVPTMTEDPDGEWIKNEDVKLMTDCILKQLDKLRDRENIGIVMTDYAIEGIENIIASEMEGE